MKKGNEEVSKASILSGFAGSKVKKEEEVKVLEEKITDLENKWKRALADYANLERRVGVEREELIKFANAELLRKILNIFDHLEKAEEHLKDEGLKIVVRQFRDLFNESGVTEIEVLGKLFDPNVAECVEVIPGEDNKVLEVLQKGYKLNDTVLRPAKVKVGKKEISEKET